MINSIHRYVDDIGTVDEIKRWSFNILSFNMLCKENGLYYPLQLGLVDYSIEQGFIRAFHKFIDPGPIPLGFASAAKDHSEATHGIPITGFEEGTTDYRSVVRDLMAYLRLPIDEANLPPLFCMQDHISQAACILAACCGSRNMGGSPWTFQSGTSCHFCASCELWLERSRMPKLRTSSTLPCSTTS
ncbi:protein maelstrom homolog isoform X1 [Dermacentor silvarum]|uniref:protein maelstrom homolog isoform X1 n=1 Tax=Dermacentor silvarum TaxID=543639 RepID=UPI00189BF69A|nr:protein maelstrom homolog isoform X1 [Dermacentor silvarum]